MDPAVSEMCPSRASGANPGPVADHPDIFNGPERRNYHSGWRRVVLNFTPAWFAVTMGTGITSILLHNLPYNADWLRYISIVIFCLNIAIFVTFLIISILRYLLFAGIWKIMLKHPVQSLFLGTIPMGLVTIINMIVFVCVPVWGDWAAHLAWALWWVDVVLAIATNFYLPFVIMRKHSPQNQLSTMTATWLLPIVATIVAAASGGVIANVLPNVQHAIWTIVVSYILWGCGVPLAMMTMTLYFHRLTMHNIPPREVIVSVFLPLGPLGQGAYAIMQLGKDSLEVFAKADFIPAAPVAGQVLYVAGILMGLIMWGFGLVWLFFALGSISRSKFPFNLGWWGFTFPLGVYSTATTMLAQELPSTFFRVLGTIFSLTVVFLWVVVSCGTVYFTLKGELIRAPCLKEWEAGNEKRCQDDANRASDSSQV